MKLLRLSSIGLILAMVAVVGFMVFSPVGVEDASAICCCDCPTSWKTTPSRTVGGSGWTGPASCDAARAELLDDLRDITTCTSHLDICKENFVITTDCEMNDPKWYPVTGYLRYNCWDCDL
jgi:hypothetical protein